MSSKIQLIYPLLLVLVLQACAAIEYDEEWELWKSVHKKSYTSVAVDTEKYRTWMNNKKFVYHHNLNMSVTGYTLALNQFADLVSNNAKTHNYRRVNNNIIIIVITANDDIITIQLAQPAEKIVIQVALIQ